MNALNLLKQGLLKQKSNDEDAVNVLCMVMEICGGYKQLMELPLPAIDPILKYLKWQEERENKKTSAMFGKKK